MQTIEQKREKKRIYMKEYRKTRPEVVERAMLAYYKRRVEREMGKNESKK